MASMLTKKLRVLKNNTHTRTYTKISIIVRLISKKARRPKF